MRWCNEIKDTPQKKEEKKEEEEKKKDKKEKKKSEKATSCHQIYQVQVSFMHKSGPL